MDIGEVKRRYGDRLCLIGNVEVDALTRGTREDIQAQVHHLLHNIAPGGGYCLGSSNTIPNYVRLENYRTMLDATLEWGCYPIKE